MNYVTFGNRCLKMRNSLIKYAFPFLALITAGLVSCEVEGPDNRPDDPLKVSRSSILVGGDAEKVSFSVTSRDGIWTLSDYKNWCPVSSPSGGEGSTVITVDITANAQAVSRETTFKITSDNTLREIVVHQLAEGEKITKPNQNKEYYINENIYEKVLKERYLWNEEVASSKADYNQDYDRFFNNYLIELKKNDLDGGIWAKNNDRYVYSYVDRRSNSATPLVPLNYGMEFELATMNSHNGEKMVGRVLYVMPGSPAATAGLKRGTWFRRVNDIDLEEWRYTWQIDTLVRPIAGEQVKLDLVSRNYSGMMVDNGVSTTISSSHFTASPILHQSVIPQKNALGVDINTAYMVYNSFALEYANEVIEAFAEFKSAGVSSLILDLRYNKSGSVEMAELLANLIAPQSVKDNGQTFAKYEFNSLNSGLNKVVKFDPAPNSIAVERLVVITSQHTAGASELLINAFNQLEEVELILVGDITEGMSGGMSALNGVAASDKYIYDVYPVAYRCSNERTTGNYRYGLSPNGTTINEWDPENVVWNEAFGIKATTGKNKDMLLIKALQYTEESVTLPESRKIVMFMASGSKQGYPRIFLPRPSMTMKTE